MSKKYVHQIRGGGLHWFDLEYPFLVRPQLWVEPLNVDPAPLHVLLNVSSPLSLGRCLSLCFSCLPILAVAIHHNLRVILL